MATLTFSIVYGTDLNLVISASELKERYLYGIPFCNQVTGQTLSDEAIKQQILAASGLVEKFLNIKLLKQFLEERRDFYRQEWGNLAFMKTSWLVAESMGIQGCLNEVKQIEFPKGWLSIHKSNDGIQFRTMYIVPNNASGDAPTNFVYGVFSNIGYFGLSDRIPNYWKLQYITGFDQIPYDVMNLIAKIAAIQILIILEPIVVGNGMFGLASQSLSLDGLGQSVSKMNGGNIFSQRVQQYWQEVNLMLRALQGFYKGITFEVA